MYSSVMTHIPQLCQCTALADGSVAKTLSWFTCKKKEVPTEPAGSRFLAIDTPKVHARSASITNVGWPGIGGRDPTVHALCCLQALGRGGPPTCLKHVKHRLSAGAKQASQKEDGLDRDTESPFCLLLPDPTCLTCPHCLRHREELQKLVAL